MIEVPFFLLKRNNHNAYFRKWREKRSAYVQLVQLRGSFPKSWQRVGFDSQTQRHMWIEFVGSLLGTKSFPRRPVFPSPKKPTFDFLIFLQCPQFALPRKNEVPFLSSLTNDHIRRIIKPFALRYHFLGVQNGHGARTGVKRLNTFW